MRIFWTILILFLTVLMGLYVVMNLKLDSSPQVFLDETNASMKALTKIAEKFGDRSTLIIILKFNSFPGDKEIREVSVLVDELEKLNMFSAVESVMDAFKVESTSLFPPSVKITEYIQLKNGLYELDSSIIEDPLYLESLISKDGRNIAIIARVSSTFTDDVLMIRSIEEIIRKNTGAEYFFAGDLMANFEFFRSIRRLAFLYPPLILLAILAVYLLKFKNLMVSALALIPSIMASIWMYFFMLIFVDSINTLTVLVPSFIIIVGTAYSMHFLSRFVSNITAGVPMTEILKKTLLEERAPIYFSALTTVAGFMSYAFLNMRAFREMGLFVSFGILTTAFFTLNILPTFLLRLKSKPSKKREPPFPATFISKISICVIIALLLTSPYFISRVSLEVDQYSFFRKSSDVIRSANYTKDNFGWTTSYYLMIESKSSPFRISNENAVEFQELESLIEKIPEISSVKSILNISEKFNLPAPLFITFLQASNFSNPSVSLFLSKDSMRFMLLSLYSDSINSQKIENTINEIIDSLPGLKEQYSFSLAGVPLIWRDVNKSIVENQLKSLVISFALIFLLLLLIFKRFKISMIAVIPILITATMNFYFMGITGIPLQISTAIVSGMLMGLVIDYSIHFIVWFRRTGSIAESYRKTASSIIINGLSLIAGFCILLTAPLVMYVHVSLLMIWGIFIGVLATLILLPVILKHSTDNRKNQKQH